LQDKNQGGDSQQRRAALYVDGFNLYHSILDLEQPHLKWCNLWRLGEIFCAQAKLDLVKVLFCTAVPHKPADIRDRHNTYNNALKAHGVEILKGHHVYEPGTNKRTEKQSDINVALSAVLDGIDDVYDVAFILSADSDQVATVTKIRERTPEKKVVFAAPPGRDAPEKAKQNLDFFFTIQPHHIEACVMPHMIQTPSGGWIRRPQEYDPPDGWVHPDDRQKGKK